jgi:hypothetical protein
VFQTTIVWASQSDFIRVHRPAKVSATAAFGWSQIRSHGMAQNGSPGVISRIRSPPWASEAAPKRERNQILIAGRFKPSDGWQRIENKYWHRQATNNAHTASKLVQRFPHFQSLVLAGGEMDDEVKVNVIEENLVTVSSSHHIQLDTVFLLILVFLWH